jgi:hypothetical protein
MPGTRDRATFDASYSFLGFEGRAGVARNWLFFPNANCLGFEAKFSKKTRQCISRVDSYAVWTKSLNAGCTAGQGSGTSGLLSYSDGINAGAIPSPVELFPLGLVPAESLDANEEAAIPRP